MDKTTLGDRMKNNYENRAISKLKKLCKNKNLTSGLSNYIGE